MSNIVNLNDLVPGLAGTTIIYNDQEYRIRGDLPSETVFEFLSLYDDLIAFRGEAAKAAEEQDADALVKTRDRLQEMTAAIRERLLDVFKLEHPEMKELPFGNQTTLLVLGEVLKAMGLGTVEDPQPPAPKPAPRKRQKTTTTRTRQATRRRK